MSKQVNFIKIITKKEKNLPLTKSKFGGLPFLSKENEIPTSQDGKQLFFLAQINCEELPENNIYPKKGILQFWILLDSLYGVNYEDLTENDGRKRIVYIPNLEDGYSEEKIKEKYKPYLEEDNSPFINNDEFSLTFKERKENIYTNVGKHQIGGLGFFTQTDPREVNKELKIYDTLLLQINSEFDKNLNEWNIIWGDSGVVNFFISEEDLKKLKFDNVLYNMDCY